MIKWLFKFLVTNGRGSFITPPREGKDYTRCFLAIGWLYTTYYPLQEPETIHGFCWMLQPPNQLTWPAGKFQPWIWRCIQYTSPFTNQVIFQQLAMLVLGAGIFFPKKILNNNRGKIPQDQPPEWKITVNPPNNHIQQVKHLSKL